MSDQIDHLSVSQLNEYLGCSQQYFYHRIAELEPIDTPSALVVGSAIHSAIEHYHLMGTNGVEVKCTELVQLFEQYLKDEEEARPVNYGKSNRDEQVQGGSLWLGAFLDGQEGTEERVLHIEKAFELLLPGLAVPIVGRVDAVMEDHEGNIIVVDYKTAATKPSVSDINSNPQMTLYGIWAKQNWKNRNTGLRMDYIIKSKKTPAFLQYDTARSELQEYKLTLLFKKVHNHILMLRAEVIDPLPQPS
jgi:RecB family exonuclease